MELLRRAVFLDASSQIDHSAQVCFRQKLSQLCTKSFPARVLFESVDRRDRNVCEPTHCRQLSNEGSRIPDKRSRHIVSLGSNERIRHVPRFFCDVLERHSFICGLVFFPRFSFDCDTPVGGTVQRELNRLPARFPRFPRIHFGVDARERPLQVPERVCPDTLDICLFANLPG